MKDTVTWRLFSGYLMILFFMLLCSGAFSQIQIAQFNAGWNKANEVSWVMDLEEAKQFLILI